MFQAINEYWDLIANYTNPFKIIFSSIVSTIIVLIITIIALIFLRKIILIKRKHIILRILSISYFILIPIIMCLFGFKWGLINGVQNDLKEHAKAYTSDLSKSFNMSVSNNFKAFFVGGKYDSKLNFSPNEGIEAVSDLLYQNYGASLENMVASDNKIEAKVSFIFLKIFKGKTFSIIIKTGIEELVDKSLGLDKDVTQDVLKTKLDELLKEGVVTKIILIQIDKLFNGMKNTIYIIVFLILLIPTIEIAIAYWLNKKELEKTSI